MKMDELKAYNLKTSNGKTRIFYYRDQAADKGVLNQIFGRKDYSLRFSVRKDELRAKYSQIIRSGKTPLIIDAGANIGASAVWFQSVFPGSLVVGFEPDAENYEIATRNTYGLNVELVLAAVGSEDGRVEIMNPHAKPWAFRTAICDDGAIKLVCLNRFIREKSQENCELFIVKVDIEGGEKNLFEKELQWLPKLPLLIIELHDYWLAKQGASKPFLCAIAPLDRDFVYRGENIFSINHDLS
jgi:FkbM family methyltransferase